MAADSQTVLKSVKLPSPNLLSFVGAYNSERSIDFKITNESEDMITFKMKLTGNNVLRITPGYGFVKPKESTTVKITALPRTPQEGERHRVVVLLAMVPKDFPKTAKDLWTSYAPIDPLRHSFPLKFFKSEEEKKAAEKEDEKASENAPAKQEDA